MLREGAGVQVAAAFRVPSFPETPLYQSYSAVRRGLQALRGSASGEGGSWVAELRYAAAGERGVQPVAAQRVSIQGTGVRVGVKGLRAR